MMSNDSASYDVVRHINIIFFVSKQKTAYDMRISVWSSDVCSSDLRWPGPSDRLWGVTSRNQSSTGWQRQLSPVGWDQPARIVRAWSEGVSPLLTTTTR